MHLLLLVGDITSQGFVNKKRKLYEQVTQCVEPTEPQFSTSESPSTSSIATALSNSSVHTALNKLFNKKHTAGGKGGRCKTKNLLPCIKKPASATASSSKVDTVRASPSTKEKPITVACIENSEAMTVPKDKTKLRSSGMLKMCMLTYHSSNEDITSKISQTFGKAITIMLATKSGELFDAPNDMSGERLLDIVGNSYLYVRPAVIPPPPPPERDAAESSMPPQQQPHQLETNESNNSEEGT